MPPKTTGVTAQVAWMNDRFHNGEPVVVADHGAVLCTVCGTYPTHPARHCATASHTQALSNHRGCLAATERDTASHQALALFWETSPHWGAPDPQPIMPDRKAAIVRGFNAAMARMPHDCAACGRHQLATGSQRLMRVPFATCLACPPGVEYAPQLNHTTHHGSIYHLDPELVNAATSTFKVCEECEASLLKGKVPPLCFASGLDFGSAECFRQLPELTAVEKSMVARVCHFTTILKVRHDGAPGGPFVGHNISFRATAPATATVLPREPTCVVIFVGPSIAAAGVRQKLLNMCAVRPDRLLQWLGFLKMNNRFYSDIEIRMDPDELMQLAGRIVDQAHVVASGRSRARDVLAGRGAGRDEEAHAHDRTEEVLANLGADTNDALQDLMRAALATAERPREERRPPEEVHFEEEPINEFEDADEQLVAGFPHLFPVFGELQTLGLLTGRRLRHIMLQRGGRFMQSGNFAFLHFNQMQRHAALRQIASVKGNFADVERIMNDPSRIENAIRNPEAPESVRLSKELSRLLTQQTRGVPFSPAKRRACLGVIMSYFYFGGCPTVYYTISPADMDMKLTLMLCAAGAEEVQREFVFPLLGGRVRTVATSPGFAAEVFHILICEVFRVLIGVPATHMESKKTARNEYVGIFGNVQLNFAVVESQGRGSLHAHGVAWGSLPSNLLSEVAGTMAEADVNEVVDTMFCTSTEHLPPLGAATPRPATRTAAGNTPAPGTVAYDELVRDVVASVQLHKKCEATCFKGSRKNCRFGMPTADCERTACYHINRADNTPAHDWGVSTNIPPRSATPDGPFAYEPRDDRPITYLTERPVGCTRVVSFNDVLSACAGCNTAVFLLGSHAQAVSVLFYLVKYLTKDSMPLENSLVCFKEAQDICIRLQAADGDDEEEQERANFDAARMLMKRFANRHLASTETSAQMAFSATLGHPSEFFNRDGSFVRPSAAVSFFNSLCSEDEDDDDDSYSDRDAPSENDDSRVILADHDGVNRLLRNEEHYAHRGPHFLDYCLYEYAGVVGVRRKKVEPHNDEPQPTTAGRKRAISFAFTADHPLHESHEQYIRSKMTVPMLLGRIARAPKANAEQSAIKRHAAQMTILFRPWTKESAQDITSEDEYAAFLLAVKSAEDQVSRTKFQVMQNVARGLACDEKTRSTLTAWRYAFASEEVGAAEVRNIMADAAASEDEARDAIADAMAVELSQRNRDNIEQAQRYIAGLCEGLAELFPCGAPGAQVDATGCIGGGGAVAIRESKALHQHRPDQATEGEDWENPFQRAGVHGAIVHLPAPPPGCILDGQQRAAFDSVVAAAFVDGAAQRHFIIHGGPGCGKSFLTKVLVKSIRGAAGCAAVVKVTASTGVAALNIGGVTVHRAFAISVGAGRQEFSAAKVAKLQAELRDTRVVIIDEVGMVDFNTLSLVDLSLQRAKRSTDRFGGVAVVLVGDFFQLGCTGRPLYSTDARPLIDSFALIDLRTQHRVSGESDGDRAHKEMIEDARHAGCGPKLLEYVRKCQTIDAESAAAINAPIVVASNAERCSINRHMASRFAAMGGKRLYSFELASSNGNEETKFHFVEGAPAVITDNVSQALGLVNGAQCVLHHLSFNDPSDALRAAAAAELGCEVVIPKPAAIFITLKDDPTHTPYPMCLSGFKTRTDLAKDVEFVAFQCDLAFAFTFHKIQGVSVDNLVLDLNKRPKKLGVIRHGHVYVALTRVRSAAGLFILPERGGGLEHLKTKEPSKQLLDWLARKASQN